MDQDGSMKTNGFAVHDYNYAIKIMYLRNSDCNLTCFVQQDNNISMIYGQKNNFMCFRFQTLETYCHRCSKNFMLSGFQNSSVGNWKHGTSSCPKNLRIAFFYLKLEVYPSQVASRREEKSSFSQVCLLNEGSIVKYFDIFIPVSDPKLHKKVDTQIL